jgi:hypothetical protein
MPDANPPGDRVESINLDAIQAPKVISNEPDTQSKLELDDERRKLENAGLAQDITARRKYAFRVFLLVIGWIIGIYLLLVFQGFGFRSFHLSDNILLAAIGSTTANIIGILLIIVKYLFSGRK